MALRIPPYISEISPYVPGKPIETLEREYGISGSIKLASNENPLGPSPKAVAAILDSVGKLNRYPDGAGFKLLDGLASHLGVEPGQIIIGNGSDEILAMLSRALLQPGDEVIVPTPSFLMYTIVAQCAGAVPVKIPLKDMRIDLDQVAARCGPKTRLVFICNPNNPTGTTVSKKAFSAFLKKLPHHLVVVLDEAYIEFARDPDLAGGILRLEQEPVVVTLRTFSKVYGLAGLRVGYGIMPAHLAELLNRVRPPFNVNTLAQAAALAALEDKDFLRQSQVLVHEGLDLLYEQLRRRGITCFESQANFFLIDVRQDANRIFEALLRQGVIVRSMAAYGYPHYIRVNVGLPAENQRFLDALDSVLKQ